MKFVFIFLAFVFKIDAQEVLLDGTIYDQKTKKTISYVHISIMNTLKEASTDERGYFFIDVPAAYLEKKVHLSALGYKDTIVAIDKIVAEKQFGMVEEPYELDDVIVSKPSGELEVLHPIASSDLESGFPSATTPWILATYFSNLDAKKKYVNKITVFLKKDENFKRPVSKFRLRVYDVDTITKKPSCDLLHESMVLEVLTESDFVSVDLSDFNIEMPRKGIYIGLEWLFVPYNWYVIKGKDPISNELTVENGFAPTFGGVYNKNQNSKVMVYRMGEWTDYRVEPEENTENLVPAVSLRLSKEK